MSNPFHFSVGVSVGPFSAGVDVGELIDLVFNRKVNENAHARTETQVFIAAEIGRLV